MHHPCRVGFWTIRGHQVMWAYPQAFRELRRHLEHDFRAGGESRHDLELHPPGPVGRTCGKEGQGYITWRFRTRGRDIVHNVEIAPGDIVITADESGEGIP